MSDDSDVDILFEEIIPLKPHTPAFMCQQLHLLENLQKNHNYIPTDYEAFLDYVKALKTSYQPAVVLSAWKVLLDKHLLVLGLGEKPQKKNSQVPLLNTSHKSKHSKEEIYSNNSNTERYIVEKTKRKNNASKIECKESSYDYSLRSDNTNLSDSEIYLHDNIKVKHKGSKHKKSDTTINNRSVFEYSKSDLGNSIYLKCQSSVNKNQSFFTSKYKKENDKQTHKRKKDESNFIKKSISCPENFLHCSEILNRPRSLSSSNSNSDSLSFKEKNKKSGSKRKKLTIEIEDDNCSYIKKKKSKRKSLEDLCSPFLDDSSKKIKSKINIKNMEKSDLNLCGISKSELIKFYKEQNEEKIVENKTLETKMLEQFHDRLVDVIIPKCFSSS